MSGRDRNRLCWCGSGKKYKKCHLGRESQQPVSMWDARLEMYRLFSTKTCLHTNAGSSTCLGPIVKAHTVRRSADLEAIARNGHVYHPSADLASLHKTGGKISASLIGINEASTFWGFCHAHDMVTFSPLETQPLVPTQEQAFLLAYRPLVKELYLKERRLESLEVARRADKGRPLAGQLATQGYVHYTGLGVESAIRDLRHHKSLYDKDLIAHDYGAVRFVAVHLAEAPDVMCSGMVQPSVSFSGQRIQNLANLDEVLQGVAFSLVATDSGGSAIFSWRADSDSACGVLVDSLLALPSADIPSALVRFAISEFENTFFRPEWWESLPSDTAQSLTERFMHGVDPHYEARSGYLEDDGVRAVSWNVRSIEQKRA